MLGKPVFTNKIVAKKLNVDEKKVAGVVEFMFAELATEIRECNHPFIYVKGLGTFTLKVSTIEKRLRANIKRYRALRDRGMEGKDWGPSLAGTRKELFELFRIRRLIKQRRAENAKIKNERKNRADSPKVIPNT